MVRIQEYSVLNPLNIKALEETGFRNDYGLYRARKILYKYDNTNHPFVILEISIDNDWLTTNVICEDGTTYSPFYTHPTNDMVCEKIISRYNNYMDGLVKKKILKRCKKDGECKN